MDGSVSKKTQLIALHQFSNVNDHRLKPVASGYGWKPDRSAIRPINPLSHRERAGERESNQQAVSS